MIKNRLVVIAIIFCLVQYFDSAIGYGSTATEEERAHRGFVNEAALTQAKEERQRIGLTNEAWLTQKEEQGRLKDRHNDASQTEAAERAARN